MKIEDVLVISKFSYLSHITSCILIIALIQQQYILWNEKSCTNAVLNTGTFGSNTSKIWKPDGCTLKNYNTSEIQKGFEKDERRENLNIVLMGDSRIRYLYDAFGSLIFDEALPIIQGKHLDRFHLDKLHNISLRFYWRAYIDEYDLNNIIQEWKVNDKVPNVFILGFGLHQIAFGNKSNEGNLAECKQNLTMVVENLNWLSRRCLVAWYVQPPTKGPNKGSNGIDYDALYVAWLPEYNAAAKRILSRTQVKWWGAVRFVGASQIDQYIDTIHLGKHTNTFFAQMIFNVLLNKDLELSSEKGSSLCCRHLIYNLKNLLVPFLVFISLFVYFLPLYLIKEYLKAGKVHQNYKTLTNTTTTMKSEKYRSNNIKHIKETDCMETNIIVNFDDRGVEKGGNDQKNKVNEEIGNEEAKNSILILDKMKFCVFFIFLLSVCERSSFFTMIDHPNFEPIEIFILCLAFIILSFTNLSLEKQKSDSTFYKKRMKPERIKKECPSR